jgi:RNA recognition motif-containing protein
LAIKTDYSYGFPGLNVVEIVFGKEPGEFGRSTGEAYIRFESKGDAEQALKQNGQYMGRR